jgi:hypothetical protein
VPVFSLPSGHTLHTKKATAIIRPMVFSLLTNGGEREKRMISMRKKVNAFFFPEYFFLLFSFFFPYLNRIEQRYDVKSLS